MALTVGKVLIKVFGSRNERLLKRYRKIVEQINAFEPKVSSMTDPELHARTQELREGLIAKNLKPMEVMPEAFALIRESMDRHIGIRAIFNPETNFDPEQFDDEMLQAYDQVQKAMISTGQSWERVPIPPQIYDAVRKLYPESRPPFRARCFDVQLIGGLVLYEGKIAEMATGEGKTFVAPLACFMRVLEGFKCHVVTVNDYLVRRDASWVRSAFENLGVSVGFIQSDFEPGGEARGLAYKCDITYGTNSEFGFDFLRDNMKEKAELQVQGPLDFAIVDEVDSILIDEARTPLIISGAAHDDAPKYRAADVVARKMLELNKTWDENERKIDAAKRAMKAAEGDEDKVKGKDKRELELVRARQAQAEKALTEAEAKKSSLVQYYEVELDRKSVHLTHEGVSAAQDAAGVGSFYVGNNMEWPHLMEQSLRAHAVYEKDKDYVIERGQGGQMEVVIVDEYTGRKMAGRQWSDGLHQAVEAKERVPIKQETQTLATITLQNFFKMYKSLSGMTGTAQTEAEEFSKIYRLEVVTIPTNRPIARKDHEDRVYRSEKEKWEAIIDEIKETADAGRPVLVGTTSVEKSEMLSTMLKRKYGVEHEVLNAKYHEREAMIVAKAGEQIKDAAGKMIGQVTIATNMAGRGTDIKLTKATTPAGGLHVIGTERHTARRIDNQLRGRSGRQGDPGSSRFYISLQDDLMKMFAGEWTIRVLGWLGMEEGMAIEDKRITKGIIRAQKKVEERNFLARKNLLEYDEVMDHQRTTFYGMRQKVLEGRDVDQVIWSMIGEAITDAVDKYVTQDVVAATICEWAKMNYEVSIEPADLRGMRDIQSLEGYIKNMARAEAATTITATLGEYMGEGETEQSQSWDVKGLAGWAKSRFQVTLNPAEIKRMDEGELEDRLRTAAIAQIDTRDVNGIMPFLEKHYAETQLSQWAMEKFGVEVSAEEITETGLEARSTPAAAIAEMIDKRARAAYARREVEYPVDHVLTYAFGGEGGTTDNAYAADWVRAWAKGKYNIDLPIDHIRRQTIYELHAELVEHQRRFLEGGALEAEVDQMLADNPSAATLASRFTERFNTRIRPEDLTVRPVAPSDSEDDQPTTARELLRLRARQVLRKELTDLEQFVLIQIFDQSWKDHLYAMDMLKGGIGLHAFAERDPRVLFKKEGFEYFQQMMAGIRDKVTDLIFRARIMGAVERKSAYNVTSATHEATSSYGVGETVQPAAPTDPLPAEAASGNEETAVRVKTIVREKAKVGRNDPCPCGSGKKYKHCCGQNVA